MIKQRVDKKDKFDCSGCSACANKCPKGCIEMVPDQLGFLYPKVYEELCINCGLCVKVCPFKSDYEYSNAPKDIKVYAVRLKDKNQLVNSQSGGMFYALSEYVLDKNGVVYGAGVDLDFCAVHKRVTTKDGREELRLSKYCQSDIQKVYANILKDIQNEKFVLFSGTPCQVAGIKSFLGKYAHSDNYIAVDLVCHGVPSPKIWKDFLTYIKKKANHPISKVLFRNKKIGWASHVTTIQFDDAQEVNTTTFRDMFYDHYVVRSSCSQCHFTNLKRIGDITIGDYWGWQQRHIEFKDNKGLSLVIISTKKGQIVFNAIKDFLDYIETDTTDCLQPQLISPIVLPKDKGNFDKLYVEYGFIRTAKRFGYLGWRNKYKEFLVFLNRYKRGIIQKFRYGRT